MPRIAPPLIAGIGLLSISLISCKSSPPASVGSTRNTPTYSTPVAYSPSVWPASSARAADEGQSGLQVKGSLASYRGQGYTVTFPAKWNAQANGPMLTLIPNDLQVWFGIARIEASGPNESCQAFHDSIASQFPNPFNFGGSQTTVYGRWQGKTFQATVINADGKPIEIACTSIAANNGWYILAMVVHSANEYAGYKVRASLANAIQFDSLPPEAKGTGVTCGDCGQMVIDTMNALTKTTVSH